ncbi:MAG: hypothetical protein WBQ77_11565, partial [Methyloceanibacter sp.]
MRGRLRLRWYRAPAGFPLLTDERGHCALCAGEDVMPYIEAMMAISNAVGLMREQVWDADPISEHSLSPD